MSKNILFILLMVGSVAVAVALFYQPGQSQIVAKTSAPKNAAETSPAAQGASSILASQEKEGITATVEKIKQSDKDTIAVLTLNNHQYDLGADRIYDEATFNGQTSLSHLFLSNAAGGHHVEVEVVFPKTTTGALVITPAENVQFTFTDLWL